jgi:hypothetical protein
MTDTFILNGDSNLDGIKTFVLSDHVNHNVTLFEKEELLEDEKDKIELDDKKNNTSKIDEEDEDDLDDDSEDEKNKSSKTNQSAPPKKEKKAKKEKDDFNWPADSDSIVLDEDNFDNQTFTGSWIVQFYDSKNPHVFFFIKIKKKLFF